MNIQDALTIPSVPDDTTLFVSEIGTLTSSVNKASAILSITDTNITMNGNALAFRTTATLVEGVHTLVVKAKNIYNGVIEVSESDPFVITTIFKVMQISSKEIINSRGTKVLDYANLFTVDNITITDASGLDYNNINKTITIPEYTLPDGINIIPISLNQKNAFNTVELRHVGRVINIC